MGARVDIVEWDRVFRFTRIDREDVLGMGNASRDRGDALCRLSRDFVGVAVVLRAAVVVV